VAEVMFRCSANFAVFVPSTTWCRASYIASNLFKQLYFSANYYGTTCRFFLNILAMVMVASLKLPWILAWFEL